MMTNIALMLHKVIKPPVNICRTKNLIVDIVQLLGEQWHMALDYLFTALYNMYILMA